MSRSIPHTVRSRIRRARALSRMQQKKERLPLQFLPIRRHPSPPERSPAADRSESGLNPHESLHLVPPQDLLAIPDQQPAAAVPPLPAPRDAEQAGLGAGAPVASARPEDGDEAEHEAGEADEEAAGDDEHGGAAR